MLQEINLTVIDTEKCKDIYSRIRNHYEISDSKICTLSKIGGGICIVSKMNDMELI